MPVSNYADGCSAISATGSGEEIMAEGLAVRIATRIQDGLRLGKAFRKTFRELRLRQRRIGAIGLSAHGEIAYVTTTEILLYSWQKGAKRGIF